MGGKSSISYNFLGIMKVLQPRSHRAWQSNSFTIILMMGSKQSSIFLGIEASHFNFSSLACMRILVICLVKAIFIALALGLSASFCKNFITSVMLLLGIVLRKTKFLARYQDQLASEEVTDL